MIVWLEPDEPFPPLSGALTEADGAAGLLAASASLTPERLLDAYRRGIFPWFSEGQPVLWWSIDPRMVLQTRDLKLSDSLRKRLRKFERERSSGHWTVTFDRAFRQVMEGCAAPRTEDGNGGTWILPVMIEAYSWLHQHGYAHSVEVWHDGKLAGGAYGVSLGRMFYGESMFARERDASKIGFAYLVSFLRDRGVGMIDCQQETRHLASFGAAPVPREQFIAHLEQACNQPAITDWRVPDQMQF